MVRALASCQFGPGSIPALSLEFVVCSCLGPRVFFPGSSVFLPPKKQTSPNSNSTRTEDPHENQNEVSSLNIAI